MSKKKNKNNEPKLTLVNQKEEELKEIQIFETFSNKLFTFMKDTLKITNTIFDDKFDIVAFIESDSKPDDIVCYTITPSSNKNVSIYVDDKAINVELNKKTITSLDILDYQNLVNNIISYLTKYYIVA